MALNFQQTDTNGSLTNQAYCSVGGGFTGNKIASVGGTVGSVDVVLSLSSSQTGLAITFDLTVGSNVSWAAGTWTVRFNITTANMNLTCTSIYICRISSGNVNQATIGSATGLSISLGTTGVKTQTRSEERRVGKECRL